MAATLTYSGELVVETCWCGIAHAVPRALIDEQNRQHRNGETQLGIFCPLGHTWVHAGKSELEREQERRKALEAQLSTTRDELAATRTELATTKHRVARGVCPCCKRSYVNVARHMAGQHPNYEEH